VSIPKPTSNPVEAARPKVKGWIAPPWMGLMKSIVFKAAVLFLAASPVGSSVLQGTPAYVVMGLIDRMARNGKQP
jgi:hypothetical protein